MMTPPFAGFKGSWSASCSTPTSTPATVCPTACLPADTRCVCLAVLFYLNELGLQTSVRLYCRASIAEHSMNDAEFKELIEIFNEMRRKVTYH